MIKSALSCFLALFLLFSLSSASLAEIIMNTDLFDPVADLFKEGAGYTGCDLDYRARDVLYLEGRWAVEQEWMMEGAIQLSGGTPVYTAMGVVWPMDLGHIEAGAAYWGDQLFLRTGLSGILPLFGDEGGPAVIWDTLFSNTDAKSSIEFGWVWCFGVRSFVLAGVYSTYTYVYGENPTGSSESLAFLRLYVDERFGSFNIQGGAKAYFSIESGEAGVGADLSCAYMFTDRIGAGLNLRFFWEDGETAMGFGINVATRM